MNRLQRLVRQRLDEKDWSINYVARRVGLNRSTLYRLMKADFREMPDDSTLEKLAAGLELPKRLLVDAAAESIGIRIYDETVTDSDTQVVIATMERLPAARRRQLRRMAELLAEEYLGGSQ